MKVNNSLQKLVMYRNDIGDNGILLVVDGLQCNNILTALDVAKCGLSVKGTVAYKTKFKTIWSLQFLYCTVTFGQTRLD